MKYLIFALVGTALISCTDNSEKPVEKENPEKVDESTLTVESMAKRHIESQLSIPATEKYTYHIYKEYLDGDEKIDAIITVNRLEFAMEEAAKSDRTAKSAEIGFMGNYNYIFYYDGGLNQISPQIAIPSSPKSELKIQFENVQSEAYKDVLVEFRVLDACFRDYYTIANHIPRRVFEWKVFGGLNSEPVEAYHFELAEGTMGPVKDILVKKSIMTKPPKNIDVYSYVPELKNTDEVVYRFFYHPSVGKYAIKK